MDGEPGGAAPAARPQRKRARPPSPPTCWGRGAAWPRWDADSPSAGWRSAAPDTADTAVPPCEPVGGGGVRGVRGQRRAMHGITHATSVCPKPRLTRSPPARLCARVPRCACSDDCGGREGRGVGRCGPSFDRGRPPTASPYSRCSAFPAPRRIPVRYTPCVV